MKRLVKSRVFWAGWIVPFAMYWTVAYFAPNKYLIPTLNALVLTISAAVMVAYTPSVWWVVRTQNAEVAKLRFLLIGIWLSWSAQLFWRAWSLLWLLSGREEWMIQNDVVGFFLFSVFCGGSFHLLSPNSLWSGVPGLRWIALGLITGAGVGLASVIAITSPDFHWLTAIMKPYVPR
jgi:hypothetical protein